MYERKEPYLLAALKQETITSLRALMVFSIILGIIYPLSITFLAHITMPYQAQGSLIIKNNTIIGSRLIGQFFIGYHYFHSRPSAHFYNAMASGSKNLGPMSEELINTTVNHIVRAQKINHIIPEEPLPADMVLTSASGLDPHISIENALLQMPRIAALRNMPITTMLSLIARCTEFTGALGFWGQPSVNVLLLNVALDEQFTTQLIAT